MQLMSQCQSGSMNTLAQGSCTYLESPGSLEMSGMMQAVAQVISFRVSISEKARIIHNLGEKEYDGMGRTVGTLFRLMKSQFGTGKTVVLDSGFCVLQGLVELKKNGIYTHALIKKKDIGQNMFQGMLSSSTSTTNRWERQMQSMENWMGFHSICMG